jgi:hypothetical protein
MSIVFKFVLNDRVAPLRSSCITEPFERFLFALVHETVLVPGGRVIAIGWPVFREP